MKKRDNQRRWTAEDDAHLIANHNSKNGTSEQIGERLGRTVQAIQSRVKVLGISKKLKAKPHIFPKEEETFLAENYEEKGSKYCAEKLGITRSQVKGKAARMGIVYDLFKWPKDKSDIVREYYSTHGAKHCAKITGFTEKQVYGHAKVIGVKINPAPMPKDGFKFCTKCRQEKLQTEFHTTNFHPSGFYSCCKVCRKQEKLKKKSERPFYFWARATTAQHHQMYGVNFSPDELEELASETERCMFCKKEFCWTNTKVQDDSPTLERLDNGSNLTLKNIAIICYQCNSTKRNRTVDQFYDYVLLVAPLLMKIIEKRKPNHQKDNWVSDYEI